jgi:hypothetical protein
MWFEETLRLVDAGDKSIKRVPVMEYLASTYYNTANYERSLRTALSILEMGREGYLQNTAHRPEPNNVWANTHTTAIATKVDVARRSIETPLPPVHNPRPKDPDRYERDLAKYERLCRGEMLTVGGVDRANRTIQIPAAAH